MKKSLLRLIGAATILICLAGCAYPQERLAQNQIPYEDQLAAVQNAVDQFRETNTGLLPIKTKDMDTPIYQKYLIDFNKLTPAFMAEPPGNAFEMGGVFQYVIVNAETEPTVKIFDLRMAETIREIKIRLKGHEYPPFKEQIESHVFTLDFEKLGYKEDPVAISPYSGRNLPFVITGDGEIYVDYRSDLFEAVDQTDTTLKQGEDIRNILVEDSPFVPSYSLPYTINEDSEPIFLVK
ncbi:hypothetical protein [Bacillus mesophilum]|uniref:ABC transporter periplasmic binding protein yphF n=1 Tax=Bacillus mesophilum TaxID=1071718 RepID=A0A7V7RMU2_9BACI|nr:hypothetical protein [Bacillus mesophilum]KAB2333693.1 hypothetical protein F7732_06285 [Bacillus mesophilum]